MSQRLRLNVDAVDDELRDRGAGAKIEIQRDTTSAFAAPTDLTDVPLVLGQEAYEVFDATGSTSNWYRFRLNNSGETLPSAWSDPFRAGDNVAYATVESLREYLGLTGIAKDNLLADLLLDASRYIDMEVGHDFRRHPATSGTEVRTYTTDGGNLLKVPEGIVSLTQVRLAVYSGGSYSTLAGSDWALYPTEVMPDETYRGVVLSDLGTYRDWYTALDGAELTGVFGYTTVPRVVQKATLDLAREWYRQGPGGGAPTAVNQFGTPIVLAGLPTTVREVIAHYGLSRFLVH